MLEWEQTDRLARVGTDRQDLLEWEQTDRLARVGTDRQDLLEWEQTDRLARVGTDRQDLLEWEQTDRLARVGTDRQDLLEWEQTDRLARVGTDRQTQTHMMTTITLAVHAPRVLCIIFYTCRYSFYIFPCMYIHAHAHTTELSQLDSLSSLPLQPLLSLWVVVGRYGLATVRPQDHQCGKLCY